MHTLKLALATAATAAALIAGGAAWAATAFTEPTQAPVERVVELEPVVKAAAVAPAPHASCEYGVDTELETIAWAEIARLEQLGLPVCETVWSFGPITEAGIWGLAYPQISLEDTRRLVVIETDLAEYDGFELTEAIRTTVRHEYGHIVTYLAGDITIDPAHEEAADAIAEALTPAGENRTIFYDETITADELAAAEALLAPYTAQTL
jgi:hypothetical protein